MRPVRRWTVAIAIFCTLLAGVPRASRAQDGSGEDRDREYPVLDFPDAELREVLRVVGSLTGRNVLFRGGAGEERVRDFYLENYVPEQVFRSLVRSYGLETVEEGPFTVIRPAEPGEPVPEAEEEIEVEPDLPPEPVRPEDRVSATLAIAEDRDPGALAEALRDFTSSRGVIRVVPREGNIFVVDRRESIDIMREFLRAEGALRHAEGDPDGPPRLGPDAPPPGAESEVFELLHVSASEVEEGVRSLLRRSETMVVNSLANTIFVVARSRSLDAVREYLDFVDREVPQVLIDAKLIEVELGETDLAGFQFEVEDQESDPGDVETSILARMLPNFQTVQGQGNSPFTIAMSRGIEPLDVSVQLLAEDRDVHLLASPSVATVSQEPAVLDLTERVPYIDQQVDIQSDVGTSTTSTEEVQFEEVGIRLEVTPDVRPDDTIRMEIHPRVSRVRERFQGVPVVDRREVETTVVAGDGQTVILGGIIQENDQLIETRIPVLGSIPLVGHLFRQTEERRRKVELFLLLRPRLTSGRSYQDLVWDRRIRLSAEDRFIREAVGSDATEVEILPPPLEMGADVRFHGAVPGDLLRVVDPARSDGGRAIRRVMQRERGERARPVEPSDDDGSYLLRVGPDTLGIRLIGDRVRVRARFEGGRIPGDRVLPRPEVSFVWDGVSYVPEDLLPVVLPEGRSALDVRVTLESPLTDAVLVATPVAVVTTPGGVRIGQYLFPPANDPSMIHDEGKELVVERIRRTETGDLARETLAREPLGIDVRREVGMGEPPEPGTTGPEGADG